MSKVLQITSLTDYVNFIESECNGEYTIFRGQSQDWPLLPKIARITPKRGVSILDTESKMLDDFKRLAKPFLRTYPSTEWEWLGIAQHHGMATRLLDWSTNPLAALWFAVNQPPKDKFGIVWMFTVPESDILQAKHTTKENPFKQLRTKIFQPEISTVRIQNQNGWFTVHKFLAKSNKFLPFEENKYYKKHLQKVQIPSSQFYKIRYQLDRMGVNKLSLFPDIDGAAMYCEWLNSFLEDENESTLTKPTFKFMI